uniref:Antitoxin of type II TA system, VapB n=1 Tax=Candidatus Kentrum sp. TUN TaxID=2126343 RepID=A0A451AIV9_9GAMM|nr:MAG: antitoxin of type II TA system, VapB [Candidatus Kentron sp. TUN]VFK65983.1 MAG: antitoxin of type II TA system, VapB [Candidatus Kentron sp. TUN]
MQTTIELDNRLIERAGLITGIKEQTALLHAGLKALIERGNTQRDASTAGVGDRQTEYTSEDKPIQLCTEDEKRQRIQAFLDFTAREGFPVEKLDTRSREERNVRSLSDLGSFCCGKADIGQNSRKFSLNSSLFASNLHEFWLRSRFPSRRTPKSDRLLGEPIFLDTNIWVYLSTDPRSAEDRRKRNIARQMLSDHPNIVASTQVLNELSNVCLKKYHLEVDQVKLCLDKDSGDCRSPLIERASNLPGPGTLWAL